MLLGLPWWIYMVIAFIFFSGYMTFRAIRAEKQLEQQYIEREGSIFMERMEYERLMRKEERNEALVHEAEQEQHIYEQDNERQIEAENMKEDKEQQRQQVSV
ncbi:Sporulation protein YhaL [Lentibacillus sp. JNUCC-1]|uniref:sporulation YhaL family protein n=1 Tax=Lentibacillus sp. JNUCC-1 TaxID=2654513 RepID=UPI0013290108|nr:Sporulation protein YhaL [Lentibacillus sp. JNUCC-1]